MTAKFPVVLILGAGPNIGQAVAHTFASKGYKVAVAARSVKEADSTDNQLHIPSDFSKTADVVNAFAEVKKVFGIPSVVIYNGEFSFHEQLSSLVDLTYHSQRRDLYPRGRPFCSLLGRLHS